MRDQRKQADAIGQLLGTKPKGGRQERTALRMNAPYRDADDWAEAEPESARAAREARIREIDALLMGVIPTKEKTRSVRVRERNLLRQKHMTRREEAKLKAERNRLAGLRFVRGGVPARADTRAAFVAALRAAWPEYLTARELCERSGVLSNSVKGWLGVWRGKGWIERQVVGEDQLYPGAPKRPLWGYRLAPEADTRSRARGQKKTSPAGPDWLE